MPNDPQNKCRPSAYGYTSTNLIDLSPQYSGIALQSSVRDLERLAVKLRHAGENQAADRIDQMIMSVLDKKIFKKLVNQSRSRRRNLCTNSNLVSSFE